MPNATTHQLFLDTADANMEPFHRDLGATPVASDPRRQEGVPLGRPQLLHGNRSAPGGLPREGDAGSVHGDEGDDDSFFTPLPHFPSLLWLPQHRKKPHVFS